MSRYRLSTAAMVFSSMVLAASIGGCATGERDQHPATNQTYAFWPQPPAEPRIQFVRSFRTSEDLAPTKRGGFEALVFGEETDSQAAIDKPYGVDMHDGKIYVCDIRKPALDVLDLDKKQVRLVGVTGLNRVGHPVDVAVADDGWIYVADNERDTVVVFDPRERYARTIGHTGMKPVSVAVYGDRLYVCDLAAQHIEIFNRVNGESIGTIGSVGDEDGQFRVPLCVDTDPDGYVYVVDLMRCRVQKFTPDGEVIEAFGEMGDYGGSFARPKQIAVDSDNILYVVDASFQNVQMFNADFKLLMEFGAAGTHEGSMNLPVGICTSDDDLDLVSDYIHPGFEPERLIAVTNQFGPNKVSLYALGHLREGWTVEQLSPSAAPIPLGVGVNPKTANIQSDVGDEEPTEEGEPQEPGPEQQPENSPETPGG